MENQLLDLKMLIFKVGQEVYGVHINQVISIERMQNITSYPNRPPHVLGVTTVRDIVTPVIDLRSALTKVSVEPTDETRLIIVQAFQSVFGLVVDAATDVLDIKADTIQRPNLLETKDISYVKGISKVDDRLLILLDIEKLLEDTTSLDELSEIIQDL